MKMKNKGCATNKTMKRFIDRVSQKSVGNLETFVEKCLLEEGIKFQKQPNGTQQYPDFYAWLPSGLKISIECKSSKGTKPVWNGGFPEMSGVYIFRMNYISEVPIVFMGRELITKEDSKWLNSVHSGKFRDKILQLQSWINSKSSGNIELYFRNMFNQKVSMKNIYENREQCKKKVLEETQGITALVRQHAQDFVLSYLTNKCIKTSTKKINHVYETF